MTRCDQNDSLTDFRLNDTHWLTHSLPYSYPLISHIMKHCEKSCQQLLNFFLRIETSTPLTMIGELPLILYFHWLSLSIHSILKQNHIWWNWIKWGRKEMKNLRKCQIFNLKKAFLSTSYGRNLLSKPI